MDEIYIAIEAPTIEDLMRQDGLIQPRKKKAVIRRAYDHS